MPILFDDDGEIDVTTAPQAVKDQLAEVIGKYQSGPFALLLLGLPGGNWTELLTENALSAQEQCDLVEKLRSYGFSKQYAEKMASPATMLEISSAQKCLKAVREKIFGPIPTCPVPLFRYAGGAGCDRSKLVALVHQARAAETALRTAILQANNL